MVGNNDPTCLVPTTVLPQIVHRFACEIDVMVKSMHCGHDVFTQLQTTELAALLGTRPIAASY